MNTNTELSGLLAFIYSCNISFHYTLFEYCTTAIRLLYVLYSLPENSPSKNSKINFQVLHLCCTLAHHKMVLFPMHYARQRGFLCELLKTNTHTHSTQTYILCRFQKCAGSETPSRVMRLPARSFCKACNFCHSAW